MNKVLYFVISLFLSLIVSLEAIGDIVHFDEHWQKREEEAVKAFNKAYNPEPFNVTNHFNHQVHMSMKFFKKSRRSLVNLKKEDRNTGPCTITNPIDGCWRCKGNWAQNRKRLADCCIGFGKGTTGGKAGEFYEVTDPSDNDLLNPKPGTLRYAVIQEKPLWITFARPMNIRLAQEMMVTSNKTIDGRGAQVHITGGAGITLQFVQNVIIHGIYVHDIYPGQGGLIRDSTSHYGTRTRSDGDAISIFQSSNIWIDHCSLARGTDGLIDIIQGSTAITVSNNHMTDHNEVLLFGATNDYTEDKKMQVTVAFNHFGKGLVQRMPRCRFGFFHVVNNDYTHWQMYAIGGNQAPTIISQGNRFIAPPNNDRVKEVTKREAPESVWKSWTWKSENDFFRNGAYFRQSGGDVYTLDPKNKEGMIKSRPGTEAETLTFFAGPRKCSPGEPC